MKPSDLSIFYALNDTEAAILTIYGEARGEPFEGKQAVGVVIENRAVKHNQTVKAVCYAPSQFSCYLSADPNYPKLLSIAKNFQFALNGLGGQPMLQECSRAWTESCPDVDKLLDGATFYEVQGTVNAWFDNMKASGKLVKTASIGHHDFYKEA